MSLRDWADKQSMVSAPALSFEEDCTKLNNRRTETIVFVLTAATVSMRRVGFRPRGELAREAVLSPGASSRPRLVPGSCKGQSMRRTPFC
jgi:hypothetical protein